MNEYQDLNSQKLSIQTAQSLFTNINNSFSSEVTLDDEWKDLDGKASYLYSLIGSDYQQLVFTGLEHFTDPEKQLNLDF